VTEPEPVTKVDRPAGTLRGISAAAACPRLFVSTEPAALFCVDDARAVRWAGTPSPFVRKEASLVLLRVQLDDVGLDHDPPSTISIDDSVDASA
jgi:hypothetical protein